MKNKMSKNTTKNIIPIFYACDDAFMKYTIVSIKSLLENCDKDRFYKIYILNAGIDGDIKTDATALECDNASIEFVCVKEQLDKIGSELPVRDYYSKTTYFRMFIADMFPEYDKAIYIDSDTIVLGDISQIYDNELLNNYVGACHEQVMAQTEVFGNYVEKVMGIDRNDYFNAGVLLINCKIFREKKVLKEFIRLLGVYTFVVTQDEDYLNVICHNKVLWLSDSFNVEVYGDIKVKEKDICIVHYIMTSKPWHYEDCRLKEHFWFYAKKCSVYEQIVDEFNSYTDAQRASDLVSVDRLIKTAQDETEREDKYLDLVSKKKALHDSLRLKKFVDTSVTACLTLT